jgi:hypothetical protein
VSQTFAELSLNAEPEHTITSTVNAELEDTGEKLEVEPILSVTPKIFPWPDQTPGKIMERLYEIGNISWSTTDITTADTNSAPFAYFTPFSLLQAKELNAQAMSFFTYFRADMEIQFRLSSNQFYSGALVFTQFPGKITENYWYGTNGPARMWMKPKVMSAQTQDVVIIRLPWMLAHRFGPVPFPSGFVPWTVAVDILSVLRTASINVPDSLNLMVHARFINPQLLVPYDGGETRRSKDQTKMDSAVRALNAARGFVKQTDHRGMPITTYSGGIITEPVARKVKIHRVVRSGDPVESSRKRPEAKYRILPTSVTSGIAECGTFIRAIVGQLQPVAKLAVFLAALFDKPSIPRPPSRVIEQPGFNMSQCDQPDQSMPLTLYGTSYLGVDPEILPDGKAWTFRDIALTPGLVASVVFSHTSDTYTCALPLGTGSGSPLTFAASNFQYFRSSVRFRLSFYCSAFLSAKFIVLFFPSPATGTPVYDIDNNLCRLIDVRGDTTVDFTVPWTCPYDVLPVNQGSFGTIVVKLYDPIVSVDTTTDPAISLVVWHAAGPDVQFFNPMIPEAQIFYWPGVERQTDIHADFEKEFPAFLNGCTYLVDNHNTQSEATEYVTDIFKRYSTYDFAGGGISSYPMYYSPAAFSVQGTVLSAFKFRRGGAMYKVLYSKSPTSVVGPPVTQTTSGSFSVTLGEQPGFVAHGNATLLQYSSDDCLDFAVPWNWVLPFASQGSYDPINGDSLFSSLWNNDTRFYAKISTTNVSIPAYYTAARDDFLVGMLQPPTPLVFPGHRLRANRNQFPQMTPGFYEALKKPVEKHRFEHDFVQVKPSQNPSVPKGGISQELKNFGK